MSKENVEVVRAAWELSSGAVAVGGQRLEYEDLDADVGLDVVVAHEGDHFSAGERLDALGHGFAHRRLEAAPDVCDHVALAAVCEAALTLRERVLDPRNDHVVPDRRACLCRAASGVLARALHNRGRERRRYFAGPISRCWISHRIPSGPPLAGTPLSHLIGLKSAQ